MTPKINVGIVRAERIEVELDGLFLVNGKRVESEVLHLGLHGNQISFGDSMSSIVRIEPVAPDSLLTIRGVTIGIGFHWQQKENQSFRGALRIISDSDALQAINEIDVESYLMSVISSEMNANAPEEFLKAHAVISRSWALAQITPDDREDCRTCSETHEEIVRWYDHSAHTLYDVCADDHCQRYQGATKASTPQAKNAIAATRGEVLMHGGHLCDTRFSKCCGGITERFSTCWQPTDYVYLQAVSDAADSHSADVSHEPEAKRWILSKPDAFCANPPEEVLATVLNNYDRDTPHLYRWTVEYPGDRLAEIIRERSGMDFGQILSLTPLHRGPSGRIDRLRIEGTKRTRIIGKELEIRRMLSTTHLYSSAFIAEPWEMGENGVPNGWTLRGAGWGHGVGLCQIGAAVMATKGYPYQEILAHYFKGAELKRLY